jgi:hypothetical protein
VVCRTVSLALLSHPSATAGEARKHVMYRVTHIDVSADERHFHLPTEFIVENFAHRRSSVGGQS